MVAAESWTCTVLVVLLDFLSRGCLSVETYGYGDIPRLRPQEEFRQHQVVYPLIYRHGSRHRRSTTLQSKGGRHVNNFTAHITAFNKNLTLDLKLNRELFSRSYIEKHFENGQPIIQKPQGLKSRLCHYHGVVRDWPHSVVALSSCQGLRGMISTEDELYYLEPSGDSLRGPHLVLRDSDRLKNNLTCGFKQHPADAARIRKHHRLRRAVHWPYDTTDKTRIVELYVANDHQQYLNNQRNLPSVISRTHDIVNIVSSLYRPLNIYIALIGIEIWTDKDKSQIEQNADATMNNFLEYRRKHICPIHKNDNAQLITGSRFTDGVVGKAVKSTICSYQYSGGVNMDHSKIVGPVATTVAHEMGHNFGMQHDDHTCDCEDDRCIMAASSGGKNPTHWSSCSKEELSDAFHQGLDYCLRDLPEQLYGGGTCQNGFLDDGEDCDCGLPQDCDNKCCNATSCQFLPNATCATGACCDLDTCQLRAATTPCRPADRECDLAEYCDGEGEFCPHDVHVENGQSCKDGQAFCFNGNCPTHQGQCRKLWGKTGKVAHHQCFQHFNPMGIANGHCGFNWRNKSFKRCAEKDVMCGMLHCEHRNERLMFWKEALAYTMPEALVNENGVRYECKGAILDVGLDMIDPGMTPDGTKCGEGMMCTNQFCKTVGDHINQCPDCHGHGTCNTLGQCHCDPGYQPPLCDSNGHGGSLHSGPISIPSSFSWIAAVVILLLIIIIVAVGIFAYRNRQQLKKFWDNRRPYKYDFIHRAKRSEPTRTANAHPPPPPPQPQRTPIRPAPTAPSAPPLPTAVVQPKQSFSKRQRPPSFRGVPISAPRLESTTKSVEDNPTMRSVGPRARPLPPIPSEGDVVVDTRSLSGGSSSGGGGTIAAHQRAAVPVAEVQPQQTTISKLNEPPALPQKNHPSAAGVAVLPRMSDVGERHGATNNKSNSSSSTSQNKGTKPVPDRPPPTYLEAISTERPPPTHPRDPPARTKSFQSGDMQVLPPPPSYPPPREPGQATLSKPQKHLSWTASQGRDAGGKAGRPGSGVQGPGKRLSRQLSSPTPKTPPHRLSTVPNGDIFSAGAPTSTSSSSSQGPDNSANITRDNPTVTFSTLKQRFEDDDKSAAPSVKKGTSNRPPVTRSVSMKGIKPPPPPKSAAILNRQDSEC